MAEQIRNHLRASVIGLAVALLTLLAGLLFSGARATATVDCTFSSGVATITITGAGESATIARTAGGQIQAGGAPCGAATVTNTNRIAVTGALGGQTVRIDLSNGGFAPGATAEGTGTSEIEFEIDLLVGNESASQRDTVSVSGTGAADTFRMGTLGVNLNGDDDADITGPAAGGTTTIRAELFEMSGLGGPDVISGAASAEVGGAFPFETRLGGGPGTDQLTGGGSTNTLTGGTANDTETGGPGQDIFDEEAAANGSDEFVGGGGPYDTLDYGDRTAGVTVDLDDVANDGEPGTENDNAHSDIRIVQGGSGADTIAANSAVFVTRTLYGGGNDDSLTGGPAGDSLYGQNGDDTMHGGAQGDDLIGGQGDDVEFGESGLDRFFEDADANAVTIAGPNGADDLRGGSEEDFVRYNVRTAGVVVTAGDNLPNDGAAGEGDNVRSDVEDVTGSSYSPNDITGNALDNILEGGSVDDTMNGVAGEDDLVGDNGPDTLYGGTENDRLQGGSGNDRLVGQANDDNLLGSFDADTLTGGPGNDTEDGSFGTDTFLQDAAANGNDTLNGGSEIDAVSYSGRSARVVVDLDGVADDGDPAAAELDNVTATVENLIGGAGNDDLTGSIGPNALTGNGGGDNLAGLDGDDLLDGGLGPDDMQGDVGTDTATYAGRAAAVVVTINGVANDGAAAEGDNVQTDVEDLVGGSGGDSLTGSGTPNVIHGGGGDDTIAGLSNNDDEHGDDGNDTFAEGAAANGADDFFGGADNGAATIGDLVNYNQRTTSIQVSIDDTADDGASGEADNVHADVESARGGSDNDVLVGSPGPNRLFGLGAGDRLDGDLGPDVLSGGDAVDTADYASRTARLEVSLNGVANDGEITADERDNVLEDVENVTGGSSNDSFFGSTLANRFRGGLGNDFFDAGHPGADIFEGGGNFDTVDYSSRSTRVAVSIDGAANDGTDADSNGIGEEGDDVRLDVETLVGGSGNDLLVASDDTLFIESLWGMGGDDLLRGLAGRDVFRGGIGGDVIEGGADSDRAFYSDHFSADGVDVSLDGLANDGNPAVSENDNVMPDVEDVWGSPGDDLLVGDNGPNKLFGDAGVDDVQGQGQDDELYGGDGPDSLDGDGGADLLQGDAGSDSVKYDSYVDPVVVSIDDEADDGADTDADGTADEGDLVDAENVSGGSNDDHLSGNSSANQLSGNAGDDTLEAWAGDDDLTGGDGADTQSGGDDDDVFHEPGASGAPGLPDEPDDIHGDDGSADLVDYSGRTQNLKINLDDAPNDGATDVSYTEGDNLHTDVEEVTGGAGNDDIRGATTANVLTGGPGNDILRAVDGTDTLWGGPHNDILEGGPGNDDEHGEAGDDDLIGRAGNDTMDGGDDRDEGFGGLGDDTVNGGAGADSLNGNHASDVINGGGGGDALRGGEDVPINYMDGGDTIHGDAGNDSITGGNGNDTLDGDEGDDAVNGERANDTVIGGIGDDSLVGGANDPFPSEDGADVVQGEGGADNMAGGLQNDSMDGGPGADTMNGQRNCDLLDGGTEADVLDGGEQACNAVTYASRAEAVFVTLDNVANDGGDVDGDGTPEEGDFVVRIQRVLGGSGNDSFTGDNGNNEFCGGGGADTLDGAAGNDKLVGGLDGDTLLGAAGNDELGTVGAGLAPGSDCPTSDLGQDTMQGQADNDHFEAQEGELDTVNGGVGTDDGNFDAIDVVTGVP